MKSTGIIRRIDDLGRIVIPKEIRKNIKIKNGDSLEIFLEDTSIVLKKYSPIESIENVICDYVETFNQVTKHNIIVTDKEKIISISGSLKSKYKNGEISDFISSFIERRDNLFERKKRTVEIIKDITECGYYSISTIINEGDAIGCVIILSLDVPITDSEEKLSLILARLLSKQFVN